MAPSAAPELTASRPESPVAMSDVKDAKQSTEACSSSSWTAFSRQFEEDRDLLAEYKGVQKEFTDLAAQFSSSVLLSTFIATLMITFLTFANVMIHDSTSTEFQIGMALCCMAAVCHISLVLVAGRAGTQTYRSSRLPRSQPLPPIEEYQARFESFARCLRLCEDVQAFGTTIFAVALLFMCWHIFHSHTFAYAVFGFVIFVGVWVYVGGFWHISWAGEQTRKAKLYINRLRGCDTGDRAV
ncbi:hypothetical protein P691DRAFT_777930 [Macrolepiota fuliginosa MF-IS2]|uniref:Uncharacterized protein n=1 Tax=Macrolepiota fuliginosa MF-IS2 TaxID=1400762 RepID=A0A9P5X7S2_9AGAR|nr:hypothetical protein P691DRAFT_777930 [Macrolepiota fuliginosa MF-IS2]